MGLKVKAVVWWMVILLSVSSFAATSSDLRLVEAVQKGDKEAARSLLKQHVNVNTSQADGATALAWAANRDDLETADLLIRAGANVNAANDYGATSLWLACSNGSAAMVERLLKANADAKAALWSGETVLMRCARTGTLDAVKSLLARGADPNAKETQGGQTALMWALADNHSEVARVLAEHGADVNAKSKLGTPWKFAIYGGGTQEVPRGNYTPLLFAAQQGDLDSVRMLLEAGAKVNEAAADGITPLLMASASDHEDLALFLLDHGADPNAADGNGITALHYAIQKGLATLSGVSVQSRISGTRTPEKPNMVRLVKALLARGVNPNARLRKPPYMVLLRSAPRIIPDGATPFLLAAASSDIPLMRLLVAAGADPRLTTDDNTTALMLVTGMGGGGRRSKEQEKGVVEAISMLIEMGNDVNAVSANENHQTAMFAAASQGMDSVIQFLAEKGARVDVRDGCGDTLLNMVLGDPAGVEYTTSRIRGGRKSTADLLRKLGGDVPVVRPEVSCSDLGGLNGRGRLTVEEVTKRRANYGNSSQ